jgi:release factor glutamine methyltransferase
MAQVLSVEQPCPIQLECPENVHVPGPASIDLARYLFSVRGKSVLDLCCGTGLFAIAAAKLGAREVWAADLSPEAVECARANAELNKVKIVVKQGDLFDPVRGRKFDVVITNPPQTPAPAEATGPKFGGPDGLAYFETILAEAPRQLEEGGQLLTFLLSIAHTKRFEEMLGRSFRFRPLPKSRRDFTREEYDGYWPGLFDYLMGRREQGLAEIEEEGGKPFFWVRYYMAMRR